MEAAPPSQAALDTTDGHIDTHTSMWQLLGGSGGLPDRGEPGAWFWSQGGKGEGVC